VQIISATLDEKQIHMRRQINKLILAGNRKENTHKQKGFLITTYYSAHSCQLIGNAKSSQCPSKQSIQPKYKTSVGKTRLKGDIKTQLKWLYIEFRKICY
jgi:hypothetical protein